jgi:hypothetical protein
MKDGNTDSKTAFYCIELNGLGNPSKKGMGVGLFFDFNFTRHYSVKEARKLCVGVMKVKVEVEVDNTGTRNEKARIIY